jgi:hypothetical protein
MPVVIEYPRVNKVEDFQVYRGEPVYAGIYTNSLPRLEKSIDIKAYSPQIDTNDTRGREFLDVVMRLNAAVPNQLKLHLGGTLMSTFVIVPQFHLQKYGLEGFRIHKETRCPVRITYRD